MNDSTDWVQFANDQIAFSEGDEQPLRDRANKLMSGLLHEQMVQQVNEAREQGIELEFTQQRETNEVIEALVQAAMQMGSIGCNCEICTTDMREFLIAALAGLDVVVVRRETADIARSMMALKREFAHIAKAHDELVAVLGAG